MKAIILLLLVLGLLTFGCCCAVSDYGEDEYDYPEDYYVEGEDGAHLSEYAGAESYSTQL